MKINIGEFQIETDERQFIVKEKGIVAEGKQTKEENIGNVYWKPIGYFTKFQDAIRFVPQQTLRGNDDISVIREMLGQIERDIKAMDMLPVIQVKAEKKVDKKADIDKELEKLEELEKVFKENGYTNQMIEDIKYADEDTDIESFIANLEEERGNWGE